MTPEELKKRTMMFGLRIIRLAGALPKSRAAGVIANQILRSGTGVGANYRAACRARSKAEFVSRMHVVEEEADESAYWIELLIAAGMVKNAALQPLLQEAREIVAIAVASANTARGKHREGHRTVAASASP